MLKGGTIRIALEMAALKMETTSLFLLFMYTVTEL